MTSALVVAVDLSTSGVRVTAVDASQTAVAEVRLSVSTVQGVDGSHVQSWREVLKSSLGAIAALAANVGSDRIAAITFSSTASSLVCVNERSDEAADEIWLWSDRRAIEQQSVLEAVTSRATIRTGCPPSVSYWPAKLLYMRARGGRDSRFAGVKDLMFLVLTGHLWTDPMTAAATGLFDSEAWHWDTELTSVLEIGLRQLPEVKPATASVPIKASFAQRLGLPPGLPVVLGGMDGPLAHLGSVGFSPYLSSATIGTTPAVRVGSARRAVDVNSGTWCYPVHRGWWIRGGAGNNGGNVVDWLHSTLALPLDIGDAINLALATPRRPDVLFVPYLNGERAPLWNPSLTGSFHGLTTGLKPAELFRAGIDGVNTSMLELALAVWGDSQVDEVRLTGGFLRNDAWAQALTDSLGVPTGITAGESSTGLGATLLAWMSLGDLSDIDSSQLALSGRYSPSAVEHRQAREALNRLQESRHRE